jgi:hypothetical protein
VLSGVTIAAFKTYSAVLYMHWTAQAVVAATCRRHPLTLFSLQLYLEHTILEINWSEVMKDLKKLQEARKACVMPTESNAKSVAAMRSFIDDQWSLQPRRVIQSLVGFL